MKKFEENLNISDIEEITLDDKLANSLKPHMTKGFDKVIFVDDEGHIYRAKIFQKAVNKRKLKDVLKDMASTAEVKNNLDTENQDIVALGQDEDEKKVGKLPKNDKLLEQEGFYNQRQLLEKLDQIGRDFRAIKKQVSQLPKSSGKLGRRLNENFSEQTENVPVKLTLPPSTASMLNKRVNELREAGLVSSRDSYIDQILIKELSLPH